MADAVVVTGGVYGPGEVYGDGCYFNGCTFKAKCTFGDGCTFEGCTFVWKLWPSGDKRPRDRSETGEGCNMVGGTADWVNFKSSSTWSSVTQGPDGQFTAPGCVDCASESNPGASTGTFTNQSLITRFGQVSPALWCTEAASCAPIPIHSANGDGCTVTMGTETVVN